MLSSSQQNAGGGAACSGVISSLCNQAVEQTHIHRLRCHPEPQLIRRLPRRMEGCGGITHIVCVRVCACVCV